MTTSERPITLEGFTIKAHVGCGNMYITINKNLEGKIVEVFAHIGKSGTCAKTQCASLTQVISHALRNDVEPHVIMKSLIGETCGAYQGSPSMKTSCADAIGRTIGFAIGEYDDLLNRMERKIES